MRGHAKADQGYVYAPESEAMPQVRLIPKGGVATPIGRQAGAVAKEPAAPAAAKPKSITGEPISIRPPGTSEPSARATRNDSGPRLRRTP